MKVTIFSHQRSLLGESPLWNAKRQSILWVDINKQKLYEKRLDSSNENFDYVWALPEMASSIVLDQMSSSHVWMVTDKSFGRFSLSNGFYEPFVFLNLKQDYRANDGGVSPDGSFWFGSMEKDPVGLNGAIYKITKQGELCRLLDNIGIPNTFCWSKDGATFFLSDSFKQQLNTYRVKFKADNFLEKSYSLVDLNESSATPDGGAMDENNNIWNCQWDGFKVACHDVITGELLNEIRLPVPRPTSCCFGGVNNNQLFITTASEGLAKEQMDAYPLSGKVFQVELPLTGAPVSAFLKEEY